MKKWYVALSVVLLINILGLLLIFDVFTACGNKGMSGRLKAEVEAVWEKEKGEELIWDDKEFGWTGNVRYYGTYQGAVVLFEPWHVLTQAGGYLTVAGEIITWPFEFGIYVYKDGTFCEIQEAYDLGILTQENIQEISEIHNEYFNNGDFDWRY